MEHFVDEEIDVWVKLLVRFETEEFPGVRQTSYHEFIDQIPELDLSQEIVSMYLDTVLPEIDLRYEDLPEPEEVPTHDPSGIWH